MTWFDPEPAHINSIQPRKRTLWAPTPTIVLRDGRPLLGIGAPGGRRIISALVQSLVNVLDFGMSVQEAVTTTRIHCEGPVTEVDGRMEPDIVDGLTARGHQVKLVEENSSSFRFARPRWHPDRSRHQPAHRRSPPVHSGLGDGLLTEKVWPAGVPAGAPARSPRTSPLRYLTPTPRRPCAVLENHTRRGQGRGASTRSPHKTTWSGCQMPPGSEVQGKWSRGERAKCLSPSSRPTVARRGCAGADCQTVSYFGGAV